METNQYELYAFQMLHFFVSEHQYQMVTIRQLRKDMWLVNREQKEFPLIRLSTAEDEAIRNQQEYMQQVKMILLGKEHVNQKVLILNTNPQSTNFQAETFHQIAVAPNRFDDEHLKAVFTDIDTVVHDVEDPAKEFIKLSRALEEIQIKAMRKKRKKWEWKQVPKLTGALMILCIVITILASLTALYLENDYFAIVLWGAYYKMNVVSMHEYWRLLTAGFLHIDIFHLAANMMALYTIGGACEKVFAKKQYLTILLVSIITGNIFVFLTEGNTLGLGISGGIFGLLGAFIASLYESGSIGHPMVRSSVYRLLLMNLIISLFPGISLFAHLGGFVAGIFLGVIFSKTAKWKHLRLHFTISFVLLLGVSCVMGFKNQNVDPLEVTLDRGLLTTVRSLGFDTYADYMQNAYLQYYSEEELGL